MKIQNIFFLLLLLGVKSLSANNLTGATHIPLRVTSEDISCNLPAPASIYVVIVNADSVTVAWSQVQGASQYRLSIHNASNGNLLSPPVMISASHITATLPFSGSDGEAFVRIHSVCPSGEWNSLVYNDTPDFPALIVELVATGFTYPITNNSQTVGYTKYNGADIKWTQEHDYFVVWYEGLDAVWFRRFALYGESYNHVKVEIGPDNGEYGNRGHRIIFQQNFENGVKVSMYVRFREDPSTPIMNAPIVAELKADRITANGPGGVFFKTPDFQNSKCTIYREYSENQPMSAPGSNDTEIADEFASEERNAMPTTNAPLSANPNPFRDAVTVQLPESKTENTRMMYLYDLLGARRMSYQVPAKQTECTLNTSLLTPGVYFLRIETDGKMETLKLLKTQ